MSRQTIVLPGGGFTTDLSCRTHSSYLKINMPLFPRKSIVRVSLYQQAFHRLHTLKTKKQRLNLADTPENDDVYQFVSHNCLRNTRQVSWAPTICHDNAKYVAHFECLPNMWLILVSPKYVAHFERLPNMWLILCVSQLCGSFEGLPNM